jgi:hypothetical protein
MSCVHLVRIFQNSCIRLEVLSNYEIDLIPRENKSTKELSEHEMAATPGVRQSSTTSHVYFCSRICHAFWHSPEASVTIAPTLAHHFSSTSFMAASICLIGFSVILHSSDVLATFTLYI